MRLAFALGPLAAAALALPCAAQPGGAPQAFVSPEKGHCIACHQVPEGAGPRTRADLGPALTGERMRALGRARIREIIEDPTRANPDTVMPPYGRHRILDAAEIRQLVEYLHALP
jgi:sulfur-oxidizing protein SoxX